MLRAREGMLEKWVVMRYLRGGVVDLWFGGGLMRGVRTGLYAMQAKGFVDSCRGVWRGLLSCL